VAKHRAHGRELRDDADSLRPMRARSPTCPLRLLRPLIKDKPASARAWSRGDNTTAKAAARWGLPWGPEPTSPLKALARFQSHAEGPARAKRKRRWCLDAFGRGHHFGLFRAGDSPYALREPGMLCKPSTRRRHPCCLGAKAQRWCEGVNECRGLKVGQG
jgi:hypothetical protein